VGGACVAAIENDQWLDPTPCAEWSVRELVNHVVAEELWAAPLLRGATVLEVGSQFDGDVLGEDPLGRARMGAGEAVAVVDALVPGGGRFSCRTARRTWGSTCANCAPTT